MFRSILFWLHLVAGVVAGVVILLMSATGVALTFQPQILAGVRSELRQLQPPQDGAERLSIEALVARAQAHNPEAKPSAVTIAPNPNEAVIVRFGRRQALYLNPWTGDVLDDPASGWQRMFTALTSWHRWLGTEGEGRAVGKAITGASNLAFVVLGVTGLYLWFPNRWKWKRFRRLLWFRRNLSANARDLNWHQVIGFWTLPVILVLAVSGVVISYPWAQRLVYTLSGEPAPPPGRPGPPQVDVPTPPEGTAVLGLDALVAQAARQMPDFRELTAQLGPAQEAAHFTLKQTGGFPAFASTALALDPHTADVLYRASFEDQTTGRRMRGWLRFLHTGEALGWIGQLVAGLASAGGVLLVWTGLFMSWRRFERFRRRRKAAAQAAV